ncbi:hypothetical protein, partial [Microbulbifer sp. 2205BS26-8]|uniref:hypothetical protein n=1 Tax=Microbulbifer sp. 2205BS26-8 TaxID=3064386 RepID=UPI00273DB0C1
TNAFELSQIRGPLYSIAVAWIWSQRLHTDLRRTKKVTQQEEVDAVIYQLNNLARIIFCKDNILIVIRKNIGIVGNMKGFSNGWLK